MESAASIQIDEECDASCAIVSSKPAAIQRPAPIGQFAGTIAMTNVSVFNSFS